MTTRSGPEGLRVYQLAQELVQLVDRVSATCLMSRSLRDQLQRASESVMFNIAEGAGHFAPGRKLYHYQTARGSASETLSALTRIHRRNAQDHVREARDKANMICIMLTPLIRKQEERRNR